MWFMGRRSDFLKEMHWECFGRFEGGRQFRSVYFLLGIYYDPRVEARLDSLCNVQVRRLGAGEE